MYNNKSVLSFGLLISSLVMLSSNTITQHNNNAAMAQGYESMTIVVIANIQLTIKNMSVEQVHSKASL